MNISQLLGARKFSTLRSNLKQFLTLYPKWARAKKMGGADAIESAFKGLLEKNSSLSTRLATIAAERMPAIGGMLQGGQALALAPSLAASAVCGGSRGDYDEKRNLDDLSLRIEGMIQKIPEWGDESVVDLQADSALLADLQLFMEYKEDLDSGGPSSKVGPVLNLLK